MTTVMTIVAAMAYHFFPRSSLFSNAQEKSSIELEVIDKEINNEPSGPWYDSTDESDFDCFLSLAFHFFIYPTQCVHEGPDEDNPETDIRDKREEIIGHRDEDTRYFTKGYIALTESSIGNTIPIFILKKRPLSMNPGGACGEPDK